MLLPQQDIKLRRKFRHPLIATGIGVIIGLFFIAIACYAIYSSRTHLMDCKQPQNFPLYYPDGSLDKSSTVSLCRTTDQVQLQWRIQDSHIVSKYTDCHDPLYRADSVGVMLKSPLYRYVNNYYAFIINPEGIVYSQDISPYYNTHTHVFDCEQVKADVKRSDKGWQGRLKIPIDRIGNGYVMATEIVNFFRVNIDSEGNRIISFNDKNNVQNIQNYIIESQ